MTINEAKEAAMGMTGPDLWKLALGGLLTMLFALVGILATDGRARMDRLDRQVDAISSQRQEDAGDIRELKTNIANIAWRLDRIDAKLDQALDRDERP